MADTVSQVKAAYTGTLRPHTLVLSFRPHTLVAEGRMHEFGELLVHEALSYESY